MTMPASPILYSFCFVSTLADVQTDSQKHTPLPIIVKGVQCVEDIEKCVEAGVQGVIISNHGGRQLD